jgi:hypothetical protein
MALFFASTTRGELQVENDGITLRGLLRRRHWGWGSIEKVEPASSALGPRLRILLTDGKQVEVPGFKTRTTKERALAAHWVDELNQRVGAARQTQLR